VPGLAQDRALDIEYVTHREAPTARRRGKSRAAKQVRKFADETL